MSSGIAVAGHPKSVQLMRHQGIGPQAVSARNQGAQEILLGLFRQRDGASQALESPMHTKYVGIDTGAIADGATVSFLDKQVAHYPIVPGTFLIETTLLSPGVADLDKDGKLYYAAVGARVAGSSGTFAAMAGESMVVKVDNGAEQTIKFATEASQALAIEAINAQLKSGHASAKDANNIYLESDTIGADSSIEVVSRDAAVKTKLGVNVESAVALVGDINYFTGKLNVVFNGGYKPAAQAGTKAVVEGTEEGPFDLADTNTLIVNVNGSGNKTATFLGKHAKINGASATFVAMASETFKVQFEDEDVYTITMGTEATIGAAVATINDQLIGGHCEAIDANNVRIVSDYEGTNSRVRLTSVAAGITSKIGLAAGDVQDATSNVANIHAVTVAEIKTVAEAAIKTAVPGDLLTVVDYEGRVMLEATTSITVSATSDIETILGLSTATATASTGVGKESLKCSLMYTGSVSSGHSWSTVVNGITQDDELVIEGYGRYAPSKVSLKADQANSI